MEKVKKERRFGKNLLIWFLGFLFGIIAVLGAVFACLKLIKVEKVIDIAGGEPEEVVSEEIAKSSLFDAMLNLTSFTVGDIKPVKDLILDIKEDATISPFVEIDEAKLNSTTLGNIDTVFGDSVKMKDKSKIKLVDFISQAENPDMYELLVDSIKKPADQIVVSDLEDFNTDEVELNSVLPEVGNEKTYTILRSGLGQQDGYVVLVGDLAKFDIYKVRLNKVLTAEDCVNNKFLSKLIKDDSVTLGNLGDKINDLKVEEVFDIVVFTEDVNLAVSGAKPYSLQENGEYILNDEGTYYIHKESASWLFLLYDFETVNSLGYGEKYTPVNLTVKDIDNGVSEVDERIDKATLRQLVDCGMIKDKGFTAESYAKKITDFIPKVAP